MIKSLIAKIEALPERVRTVVYVAPLPVIMIVVSAFTTWLVLAVLFLFAAYELRAVTQNQKKLGHLSPLRRDYVIMAAGGIGALVFALFFHAFWIVMIPPVCALVWMFIDDISNDRDLFIGYIWLVLAVVSAYEIRIGHQGLSRFIYALVVVAAADIGAYYGGRRFGKTALAPNISPNKTREGAYCGIGFAVIVSLVLMQLLDLGYKIDGWVFFVLPVLVAIAAIGGDLVESAFKRRHRVKDTSNILPGHGGVLDRFDGTAAAFIIAALFL